MAPVRIHPDNPKLFEFRGRPLVLLTATEHYGAVLNRPFRFERYLRDAAANGMTLTRLFTLFRELQTPINPASTCKPASPRLPGPVRAHRSRLRAGRRASLRPGPRRSGVLRAPAPLHRSGGRAGRGGRGGAAQQHLRRPGVAAEPAARPENNVNELPACPAPEYLSMRHPARFERQRAHVRRIVEGHPPLRQRHLRDLQRAGRPRVRRRGPDGGRSQRMAGRADRGGARGRPPGRAAASDRRAGGVRGQAVPADARPQLRRDGLRRGQRPPAAGDAAARHRPSPWAPS